jgi:threonine dehydratase
VLTSPSIDNPHQRFFFKVEALQRTGSFKFRGALNAILSIVQEQEESTKIERHDNNTLEVITHSSGNHAAAIACAAQWASRKRSHPIHATIVMPRNVTLIKKRAVEEYGGEIVLVDNTNQARESMADTISQQRGAYFVHPSEDPRVIAGQGTVALEFVQQMKQEYDSSLDVVIIPVGGGGLAAGNTMALRALLGDKVQVRFTWNKIRHSHTIY